MDPLRLFLLDQGFPVEYELDKFNTPHTGTTLRHPQNWLCRRRWRISLRHLATSPLDNILWRHSHFSPKQPETQTHSDFNISLLKQQTRLLLNHGEHISLSRPTTRAFLLATDYNPAICRKIDNNDPSGSRNLLIGLVSLFYGISTFVGYLMPKPFPRTEVVLFNP